MMKKLFTLLISFALALGGTAQISSLPYNQNFEGVGTGSTSCGAAQVLGIEWTNDTADDIDWNIDINGTGSTNTGPTANGGADHNPGISGGKYLYLESSSGCTLDTANLVSDPIITTGNEPNLFFEFWYHQYGQQINVLYVESRLVVAGVPGPWIPGDTLFTPPPGLDMWQQGFVDYSSYLGDTFQIRLRGVTGTSFGSDLALDDFSLFSIAAIDAGVVSIDGPTSPAAVGANNVDITIGSFGTDTLTNATVEWEFNGVAQTPFAWTGSLGLSQTVSGNIIGSANITPGVFKIKAWTSMPNMTIDSVNGNDTTSIVGCSGALRGTYTAGGPGDDFDNIEQLSFVLSTCGIDSHTVINISPGVYAERLILDHVPGAAASATLTIDGGSSSMVTLTNSSFATVRLFGTDYTTIKNMTIEALGTIDCYGVQLSDTAEYNTIDSCSIIMSDAITNLSDVIGVSASATEASSFSEGQNANWTTVSNCYIFGGEKAIHFEGQNASRTIGNNFMNNILENNEDYGFYMDDQDSMMIIGNHISGLRSTFADGIYCFDIQMFNISENAVLEAPDWGLYIADGNFALDGTPTSRGRIINNMVSSTSDYAAYFDDFEMTDIFHNTFANTSTFSGACRINDFNGLDIRNNIFYSDGDYAFESDDIIANTANNTVNYNVYWSTGPNLIDEQVNIYADLTAWQTGWPAGNVNSAEGDPVFLSALDDLHVLSPIVNDVGDNTAGIAVDIDGDVRPALGATIVDIGADEFTPIADDGVAVRILGPAGGCGDSSSVVEIVIRNLGLNDITSMPVTVTYAGAGSGTINYTYTDTLSFNEYDTVIVGTINTYMGGTFDLDGYIALAGDLDANNDTFPSYTATFTPHIPQGIDGVGCGVDSAMIAAVPYPGVSYWWFASPTDTVPLANSDTYMVPSILAQSTYYLQYANNSDSLATGFAGGNSCGGGVMIDVTATNTVNINGLTVMSTTAAGATFQLTLHWIPNGSYVGNETNAAAWPSSVGPFTVTSAGNGNETYVDLQGASVTIPAGATYGMYIEYTSAYTNGAFTYSNADISIQTGVGLCGSFSGVNNPRSFNGRLIYGSTACSNVRVPVSAVTSPGVSVALPGDTTLCGNSFDLDAGANATTYAWSTSDTTQNITVNASGTYSVVVSDTFGCTETDSMMLTLNNLPMVNLGADILLCDGASDTLDAGNPGSSYTWSTGGSAQQEVVSAAGSVNVVVTDTVGCSGTDTLNVAVAVTPASNFSYVPGAAGLTYDFTDASTGTPTTWAWDFGDGNTATTQNPTHTYATSGTYTVTLVVTNACGTNTFTESITVVGVESSIGGGYVSVYPNPNNGLFKIEFSGLQSNLVEMSVVDVKGQTVMMETIESQGSFVKEVDLTSFAKGIYSIRFQNGDEQVVQRVVVQ